METGTVGMGDVYGGGLGGLFGGAVGSDEPAAVRASGAGASGSSGPAISWVGLALLLVALRVVVDLADRAD